MMVTVLFHLSHAFDFSEGQNEDAALRQVHPYRQEHEIKQYLLAGNAPPGPTCVFSCRVYYARFGGLHTWLHNLNP